MLSTSNTSACKRPQRVPQATPPICRKIHKSHIFNTSQNGAFRAVCPCEESEGTQMRSFMSMTFLVEVALLSFLLALWLTWLGLRGLFRLLPATTRPAPQVQYVANRRTEHKIRHAA